MPLHELTHLSVWYSTILRCELPPQILLLCLFTKPFICNFAVSEKHSDVSRIFIFQFQPNLSAEVLEVPRFAHVTYPLCVHRELQIQLFVCFANGLARARHIYVSAELSVCVVYAWTSLGLVLENSPSFWQTSVYTAPYCNCGHVNYAQWYTKNVASDVMYIADTNTYLLTYSMEQGPSWEANWFCS